MNAPRKRETPRAVVGRWRRIKTTLTAAVVVSAIGLPLLRWDRGPGLPDQAVLFDFSAAHAYVADFVFGPQDLILLLALLVGAAFALFFANTLVGRVWCGFSCPQTVWTDIFVAIERALAPRGETRSAAHIAAKHAAWAAISVATGLTIVSYFADAPALWFQFLRGEANAVAAFFVLSFAALTYLLAGYAREQVCLHMCPWPRFQAAMSDARTVTVAYAAHRGEPRAPLKRAAEAGMQAGACVDCGLCVAVCPTGIDIRNGPQLGCIGCGLCADACDGVMEKIGRPIGLIGFRADGLADTSKEPQASAVRWKSLGFAILGLAAAAIFVAHLVSRQTIDLAISPERQPPYVRLSDGSIRNVYAVRVTDRRRKISPVTLRVEGLEGAKLAFTLDGRGGETGAIDIGHAGAAEAAAERLIVTVPPQSVPSGRVSVRFVVAAADGELLAAVSSYFWAPLAGSTQ